MRGRNFKIIHLKEFCAKRTDGIADTHRVMYLLEI